ncbi:hypothetical protein Tco_0319487 [Tanacetum coccineum]
MWIYSPMFWTRLNWKNRNLTDKVANLKEVQTAVEKDPFNCELNEKALKTLNNYYDRISKSRKHKGRIESICDDNGTIFEGENVAEVFVEHFKKFLGTKHVVQPSNSIDVNFDKVLNEEEAKAMINMVTDTIFDIDSNKAFGSDGFTSGFFKKACDFVGKESADKFKFHYGCKSLQLYNMCFVDDLLVLCNEDVDSVKVIKKSMEQFSSIYGLFPNMAKSTIFFRSVPLDVQHDILQVMPFQVRNLPIRYFWKDKVAWKLVCLPKEHGRLGIKSLKKWNEILLIKQLWKVIEGKESLWVKWVNVVKWDLKGPLSKFIPRRAWCEERYADNEVVADMIDNGVLILLANWHSRFPEVSNIDIPNLSNGVKNKLDLGDLWGDSVERAITTNASLVAAQDSDNIISIQTTAMPNVDIPQEMDIGGSPRSQETMGGDLAQTRSERVLEKPNEPPLSEGHTSGSGEGSMEHTFEMMDTVIPTPHDSPLSGGNTPGIMMVEWHKFTNDGNLNLLDKKGCIQTGRESDKTKSMFQDSDFDVLDEDMEDVEGEIVHTATTGVSTLSAPVTTAGVAISNAEPRTPPTTAATAFIDEDLTISHTLIKMKEEKPRDRVSIKTEEFDEIQARIDADHELVMEVPRITRYSVRCLMILTDKNCINYIGWYMKDMRQPVQKDNDLVTWGDLKTLLRPNEEDEEWKNHNTTT